MFKAWIGCARSNFRSGRDGFAAEAIVLHRTGDSLGAIDNRCKQANQFRSAHYGVGKGGEVHQYIEETDTAFHAGIVVAPTWRLIKNGKNPNLYTVALELESCAQAEASDKQLSALAELITEIAGRWKFVVDSDHLVLHSEIRAGAVCPCAGFNRAALLSVISARRTKTPPQTETPGEVKLVANANIRQSPSSTSRIVKVVLAGSSEAVTGFEDQAERIHGNSYWYCTADGYLWAGATDRPNPVASESHLVLPRFTVNQPVSLTTQCDIPGVDDLLKGDNAPPIDAKSPPLAIGAIQDLLAGHGFRGVPALVSPQYGRWTPSTTSALQTFQKDNGLNAADRVDGQSLRKALTVAAVDPRASEVYLSLVLGIPATGMKKILSLVAQMEGAGKFGAINLNTDGAGLSFGLIQWAQKPGRLTEILSAMSAADRNLFVSIFGGNDVVADGLLNHCRRPNGGVDPKTGATTDPAFNLIEEPWVGRFKQSALEKQFQKVQVQVALQSFNRSYARIRELAPDLTSERSVAFLLDVANQFGDGGLAKLYRDIHRPGMTEPDLLQSIADETVVRVPDPLKAGVRSRREHFLQTSLLSDRAFTSDAPIEQQASLATA